MSKTKLISTTVEWFRRVEVNEDPPPPSWQFWRSGKKVEYQYLYPLFLIDGRHVARLSGLLKAIYDDNAKIVLPLSEKDGAVEIGPVIETGIKYLYHIKFVEETEKNIVFDVTVTW